LFKKKQNNTIMTTEEIAKKFHSLAQEGKWEEIINTYFSPDAQSVEPPSAQGLPQLVKGLDAIREKAKQWGEMVQEVHGGYCNEPQVAGNHFVCAMGMDVTMKGRKREVMDEVALYEVKDGKIVKEQFFY
jgi:hypothetical protein